MRESELRKPFTTALKSIGALIIPYVGSSYGQRGTADVFVAHIDWHGWIEFKGPETIVSSIQQFFLDEMKKRKVNAVVVRLHLYRRFQINDTDTDYVYHTGWDIIKGLKEHDICENR